MPDVLGQVIEPCMQGGKTKGIESVLCGNEE